MAVIAIDQTLPQAAGASRIGAHAERLAQTFRARLHKRPVQTAALGLAVALLGAALAYHSSPPQAFVLLLGASVILNATRAIPEIASYLGLATAWVLFGIATPEQAVAGYGGTNWMTAVAMVALAQAVASSGLLLRCGLWFVQRLPRSVLAQGATFMLGGLALIPLLPGSTQRGQFSMMFALAAAQAQRLKERGPAAAFIAMATFIGSNPMLFFFLGGNTTCLLIYGFLPEATRAQIGVGEWLVASVPLAAFVGVASLAAMWLYLRPERNAPPLDSRKVSQQLAELGRPKGRELKTAAILALTILGWTFGPALGVDKLVVSLVMLMASILLGCFGDTELQSLPWDFLILYGIVLDIDKITTRLGITQAAGAALVAATGHLHLAPIVFLLAVAVLNVLVRLVLPVIPALMLLGLGLIPLAPVMGLSPFLVGLALLATTTVWFLPTTSYTFRLAAQAAEGQLFTNRQAQVTSVIHTAITLLGLAVCTPYWRWLGLM